MLGKRIINTATGAAAEACTTDTVQILDGVPFESIATYQLDGDANDLTTNYNGTWGGTEAYATGQFGQATVFNGSSSYIDTNISTITSNAGSVSLWVKTTAGTQSAFFGGQSPSQNRFYFGVRNNNFWMGAGDTQSYTVSAASLLDGNWHHVVLTLDGSTAKYYFDGNSTPVHTISYTPGGTIGVTPLIGALDALGTVLAYTSGSIDQVRIYNKALSADNVATLYNETVATASTNITFDAPSLVAYYKMSDATDETGSYDGTPSNVNFNVAGKFGNAGEFNGSSSSISLPTSIKPSNSIMSISLWASNNSTARKSIFYLEYNNSNAFLALENNSYVDSTALSVLYNNAAIITPAGSTLPTDGSWHHIVVTASATEVKLYKNGSQIGSTASITVNTNALTEAHIGVRHYNNDLYWDGKIDQVRIFNRAITSEEVETLYNEVQCVPDIVPASNFETVIYDGNGGTKEITSLDFQPDLVWIKNRDASVNHKLLDSIRFDGTNYEVLESNNTAADAATTQFSSFDSNGFTLGGGASAYNGSGTDYVAWCWKAAGAANTFNVLEGGTVTSDSTASGAGITAGSDTVGSGLDVWEVSANRDAGFSIVNYKNTSGDGAVNVGHGLSQAPDMIIQKSTNSANIPWVVYHREVGTGKYLSLNSTSTPSTSANVMSLVDSTSFSSYWSNTAYEFINYCFHSVDGMSKVGSYTGTGAAGNTIVTGFRPRWVMIKSTAAQGWNIVDSVRNPSNPANLNIQANDSAAESSTGNPAVQVDFFATGFSLVAPAGTPGEGQVNSNGSTYIFLAIAEEVFVPDNFFNDDSTVATYKLDGDAGDDSGNGNNGTWSSPSYGTGKFGQAAVFSSSNTGINNSNLKLNSTQHSVSMWINTTTLATGKWNTCFISSFTGFPSGFFGRRPDRTDFHYRTESGDELYFTLSNTNTWYHIVATRDANGVKIYVNGSFVTSNNDSLGTRPSSGYNTSVIGSNNLYPNEYFQGSIDQVRIFDRALDSGEVAQLYNE